MRLRLAHKGLILVVVILAVELSFLATLYYLLLQTEEVARQANHAKKVTGLTNRIWQSLTTGAGTVNYVFNHMEDKAAMREFLDTVPGTNQEMDRLNVLIKNDDKESVGKLRIALATGKKGLKALRIIIELLEKGDLLGARAMDDMMTRRGMRLSQIHIRLTDQIQDAREEQLRVLNSFPEKQQRIRNLTSTVLIGGIAINVLVAVGLLLLFARGITRRLDSVLDNTRLLTRGLPLKPVLNDSDEIGDLDRVFHEMAETLAETSRKERAIIENARDVICSLDRMGNFVSVSAACIQLWGYTSDELAGYCLSNLLPGDSFEKFEQSMREAIDVQQLSVETSLKRKDDRIVDILWSIRWHAGQENYFCVARDVTERNLQAARLKASEARARATFDSVRAGLMTVTDSGVVETMNSAARSMVKCDEDSIHDLTLHRLFFKPTKAHAVQQAPSAGEVEGRGGEDSKFVKDMLHRSLDKITELEVNARDGSRVPVEFSMKRFQGVEGERLLGNLIDVSERHQLDVMKQEFVAMISHDLRTPLNSVQGYLELLNEGIYGELPESAEGDGQQAERNVVMLLRLVNDLLDIAKLDSGKLELHLAKTALSKLVHKSIEAIESVAEEKNIKLEAAFEGELFVEADAYRLERVLVSLLLNSIKISSAGGRVTISGACVDDLIKLNVRDFSNTLGPEQRETLFERFRRNKGEKSGTAEFGLAMCKAIINEHGGNIGVDAAEGGGNNFWFSLIVSKS